MGHVFQVEWWENIIVGITFTMEFGKGISEGKEAIIGI